MSELPSTPARSGAARLRERVMQLQRIDEEKAGNMQEERFGTRDLTYSAWHRRGSVRRFVGIDRAQLLSMIDVDGAMYVEFDHEEKEPLALIEVARDVGQSFKAATVVRRLAKRAQLPAYLVLYLPGAAPNPADPEHRDIDRFRVRRLWPKPEEAWRELSPAEWATGLVRIRAWAADRLDREAANDPNFG